MDEDLNISSANRNICEQTYRCSTENHGSVVFEGYKTNIANHQRYLRIDDLTTEDTETVKKVYNFLNQKQVVNVDAPTVVISTTGGNMAPRFKTDKMFSKFKDGIIKITEYTDAWIFTEGLCYGSTMEISNILNEHFETRDPTDQGQGVHLIGFAPWGIVASNATLKKRLREDKFDVYLKDKGDNALDPYHGTFIFTDDRTNRTYTQESNMRLALEEYISKQPLAKMVDTGTPVVILVVGGDRFTLKRVHKAVLDNTPVIIIKHSGEIADMLAEAHALAQDNSVQRNDNESKTNNLIDKHKRLLTNDQDIEYLKNFIGHKNPSKKTHVMVFDGEKSKQCLFKIFMDITLRHAQMMREVVMYYGLKTNNIKPFEFLQEVYSDKGEYRRIIKGFVRLPYMFALYKEMLSENTIRASLLQKLIRRDFFYLDSKHETDKALADDNLLSQVGRIIYKLLGNKYRLLYQEQGFRDHKDKHMYEVSKDEGWCLSDKPEVEAVWHAFLWAVIANQRTMAEHFLHESDCIVGGALLACKILKSMVEVAEVWKETAYVERLKENDIYFEQLAIDVIHEMYETNKQEAYKNLVAVIPFRIGHQHTPLSIANDAKCMEFVGHAASQTLLQLIWNQYMDLDTPFWKLGSVLPFLVFWIRVDRNSLFFGNSKSEAGESQHNNLKEVWFRIKNFCTAPVVKMWNSVLAHLVFLGLFSVLVLSKLEPVKGVKGISEYEWLVYIWFFGLLLQEWNQILSDKRSGPLYKVKRAEQWHETWFWYERLKFVCRIQRITVPLSDMWNQFDFCMIILFMASVVLRYSLPAVDFAWARFLFCITLIVFYLRLLRYGYVTRQFGPRILIIKALTVDLLKFCLILSVVIISFGIAFQSLLSANEEASWRQLADVLWRPYWQMFGELFIDDDGMGRDVQTRSCYNNRTTAKIEDGEMCQDWMPPVMLAFFMMITNIMLLNLLIAIFSNSFEKIESESWLIWRFHMYDLVEEYYQCHWLPPPLNIPFEAIALLRLFINYFRRRFFKRCHNNTRHPMRETGQDEDMRNSIIIPEQEAHSKVIVAREEADKIHESREDKRVQIVTTATIKKFQKLKLIEDNTATEEYCNTLVEDDPPLSANTGDSLDVTSAEEMGNTNGQSLYGQRMISRDDIDELHQEIKDLAAKFEAQQENIGLVLEHIQKGQRWVNQEPTRLTLLSSDCETESMI